MTLSTNEKRLAVLAIEYQAREAMLEYMHKEADLDRYPLPDRLKCRIESEIDHKKHLEIFYAELANKIEKILEEYEQ